MKRLYLYLEYWNAKRAPTSNIICATIKSLIAKLHKIKRGSILG